MLVYCNRRSPFLSVLSQVATARCVDKPLQHLALLAGPKKMNKVLASKKPGNFVELGGHLNPRVYPARSAMPWSLRSSK